MPITGPGTASGHYARWHSRVRGLPEFAGELPVSVLAEEIDTPGAGRIRALITSAGNPVLSTPDGRRLERALGTLDFMLSIDISINETTRFADLILPPASPLSQYHYDLIFNAFAVRRVARLSVPLREPQAHERGDWQIFNGIAQAYAAATGKAFTALPEPLHLIAGGLQRGNSGVDLELLMAAPHGIDLGPLTPCLLDRLETSDGKVQCAPAPLMDDLPRLIDAFGNPETAPSLSLIGRRHPRSNNSWMHNAPRLVKGKARHQLHMHPNDLAARGIASGAQVRIRSAIAELQTEVLADSDLMPGVVSLPHGFGHGRAGSKQQLADALDGISYNDLSDPAALDGPTGNAALNGLPVSVEA